MAEKGPHLHGIAYWESLAVAVSIDNLINYWCYSSRKFGSARWCQNAQRIDTPLCWLMYLAKHSGRSVRHCQRMLTLPDGWEKTGRMWRYGGDWPRLAPLSLYQTEPSVDGEVRLRRLLNYAVRADIRKSVPVAQWCRADKESESSLDRRKKPWRKMVVWSRRSGQGGLVVSTW